MACFLRRSLPPSPSRQDALTWFDREELVGVEHNPGPVNGRYGSGTRGRGRSASRRTDTDPRRYNADLDAETGAIAASFTTVAPSSGSLARPWLTPDKSLSQLAESINMSMLSPAFRTLSAVVAHLRDHPSTLSFTVDGSFVIPTSDTIDVHDAGRHDDTVTPHAAPLPQAIRPQPTIANPPMHDPTVHVATRPRHKQTLAESIAALEAAIDGTSRKRPRPPAPTVSPAHAPSVARPPVQRHEAPADADTASIDDDVTSLMREFARDSARPRRTIRERAPDDTPPNPYADLSPSDLEDHRQEIEHLIAQARAAHHRSSSPHPRALMP